MTELEQYKTILDHATNPESVIRPVEIYVSKLLAIYLFGEGPVGFKQSLIYNGISVEIYSMLPDLHLLYGNYEP